jgi:hypothetical protein
LWYHHAMNCQGKRGGKTWRGADSRNSNGKPFAFISPNPRYHGGVDARVWRIAAVLRASSESSGPGPHGASCPAGMAVRAPAGGDSSSGRRPAYCSSAGESSWPSFMTSRSGAGTHALSMAVLSPRKQGAQRRPHQAGPGHEVDGAGRWRGYSVGSIRGRGVPGGSHPP